MTEREVRYLTLIEMRASQVAKFARLFLKNKQFIPNILALPCSNLQRTMMAFLPKEIRENFFSWLQSTLDEKAGVCVLCDNIVTNEDHGMCETCWEQAVGDDVLAEKLLLMEFGPTGEPH